LGNSFLTNMFPTLVRLSKASRRPLTPKRGNKDYYKGLYPLNFTNASPSRLLFQALVRPIFLVGIVQALQANM